MKKVNIFSLILGAILILSSCSTSNSVVSNKLISKRKYTKGFHFNKKTNLKTSKNEVAENEVVEEATYSMNTVKNTLENNVDNSVVLIDERIVGATIDEKLLPVEPDSNDLNIEIEGDKSSELLDDENQENKLSRTELVEELKSSKSDVDPTVMLILLIILAFIIPPLAVFLYEGASGRFWIDLILFIVGIALGGWLGGIAWLALLAAVIYALLIVIEAI